MSELPFDPPPQDKPAASSPKPTPVQRPRPTVRRPIVQESSKRDTFIAVLCGAGVLLLVIFSMYALHREQGKPSTNQLTGVITAKHDSGEKEKEISVGKKGLKSRETDSGFSFSVKVEGVANEYEVPVNEGLFRSRKVGDNVTFIRPPSEQR